MTAATEREQLLSQFALNGECWDWQGPIDRDGYGRLSGRKRPLAHRVAYATLVAPIPANYELDHRCRNRRCINPAHLEPVTKYENWRRGQAVTRLNADATHCKHGHSFNEANTYIHKGRRQCRACNRRSVHEYKLRTRNRRPA